MKLYDRPWNETPYSLERGINVWCTAITASCIADFCAHPLDVIKTRLQIQGEFKNASARQAKYSGLWGTGIGVIKDEGFLKLYSGLSIAVVRHFFIAGVRIGTYDYLRTKLSIFNEDDKLSYANNMIAGLISGAISTVASNPLDLIKLQLQMDSRRRLLGLPVGSINVMQGFHQILSNGGFLRLWRGFTPNLIRVSLYSMAGISCYDVSKSKIRQRLDSPDNLFVQFLASIIAGFACATASLPADAIKSRIMNQPIDETGRGQRYKNTWDCFVHLIKNEGPLAMYRGFLPYWLRCGPWFTVFWLSYETIRLSTGKDAF